MTLGSKRRTIIRYTLFQIPDLILLSLGVAAAVRWWGLPVAVAYGVVALWIVKDIAMFPIVRIAYESKDSSGVQQMHGALGVVVQPLTPSGYVKLGSELWKATPISGSGPISVGSKVRVIEVRGLTLLVEPDTSVES